MKLVRHEDSLVGRVRDMSSVLMIILVIPAILSLAMTLMFSGRYYRSVERMDRIAALKPVVADEIPGAVWDVVSGRETIEETSVFRKIDRVNSAIEQVIAKTGENDSLSLIVARRTMNTLLQYAEQVRENIKAGEPVVLNEAILNEIRDVASLVESMLNDYITAEIGETSVMSHYLSKVVGITAAAEILLLIFALVLSREMTRKTASFIREPIEKLESVAEQLAEGELSARIPATEVAELKNLTTQVNTMADNLEQMMERSVRDERNLKKAELRTLQAQINPHFLYNTLDAIIWKVEEGDREEVIHLTRALSDFFRISLSSGADWIPISQEKKHISGYLGVQKTRYNDILNYEIDVPDELNDLYILKLLLQPLVENALYHGIKYKRGGGKITVTGRKEGDFLIFSVADTGRGMDAETLAALRERIKDRQPVHSNTTGGFGLVNVNLRIRLYYNQPEGLKIESGPGGTVITMRLPCRREEDFTDDQSVSGG